MEKMKFIVLIDDDYATIILEESGICEEYLFFDSPIEALEYFEKEAQKATPKLPELIFLDINMPGLDGWQFLEKYTKMDIPDRRISETYL